MIFYLSFLCFYFILLFFKWECFFVWGLFLLGCYCVWGVYVYLYYNKPSQAFYLSRFSRDFLYLRDFLKSSLLIRQLCFSLFFPFRLFFKTKLVLISFFNYILLTKNNLFFELILSFFFFSTGVFYFLKLYQ